MNAATVRAELEEDLAWRELEIRTLRNHEMQLPTDDAKERFRRTVVVMLYAHYEGFCQVALESYQKAINYANLRCADVIPAIAAASLTEVFTRLENPNVKCEVFHRALPNDTQLHRFARRQDFLVQLGEFSERSARMPDQCVDTESNLTILVLRKNLFKLGLPYEWIEEFAGDIGILLNRRNKIAHGEDRDGISTEDYARLEKSAFRIIEEIMRLITAAVADEVYKNPCNDCA